MTKFNYSKEKRQFDNEWDTFYEEYRLAGMDENSIQLIKQFDLEWFRSRRNYQNHTDFLPEDDSLDFFIQSDKYTSLQSQFDDKDIFHNLDWIESITDHSIVEKLKKYLLTI